jgi:serine/threonine protein kinase
MSDAVHAPPAGFVLLPGTERAGVSVFGVQRAGKELVCKRLQPRARGEAWMRERLAAEGRLLGFLAGRGAPRLVDAGEDAHGPWFVMESFGWPPLSARTGRAEPSWIDRATRAAFDALSAVHSAGVVHGDISPGNVLVADDPGNAVLVDFGLAQGPGMPRMPPGPFRGTLAYAAPEVARSEPFDARADVFALAASLLSVTSGEGPRARKGAPAMLLAAAEETIEPWARRAAEPLEPEIGRALVACCAFEARQRPDRLGADRRLP